MRAIAIGFEVAARVSLSWSYYTVESDGSVRGADVTGLSWIVLGAAASLGLLRDLDGDAMRSALGIAAYGAPIPTNSNWHVAYPPDSMTKYTLYGALAQHAVSAIELAALGFVGCRNVLDGPRGFRRLIGATTWDDDVLRDGLPGTWTIVQTGLKRYPACRLWHGALYGLERLVRDARLAPDGRPARRDRPRAPASDPDAARARVSRADGDLGPVFRALRRRAGDRAPSARPGVVSSGRPRRANGRGS